jgi:hypothetical protein
LVAAAALPESAGRLPGAALGLAGPDLGRTADGAGLDARRASSLSSAYGLELDFTISRTGVPGRSKLCRIELIR